MDEIQDIEAGLLKLKKVKFIEPTAAQLHRQRHHLVSRVQRQEDRRYLQAVQKKKAELEKKLLDLRSKQQFGMQAMGMSQGVPQDSNYSLKLPKKVLTRMESKRRLKPTR